MAMRRERAVPAEVRAKFNRVHGALLSVHKELIDFERDRYEREYGPINSPGEALQLLIKDPWFAWLRPLTTVITGIDEFVESREPVDMQVGEALLTEARDLLSAGEAGFGKEYSRALQESAGVAAAHGAWRVVVAREAGASG
jgi:hypothetical protein